MRGIKKYAAEMGSGTVIPNFINIDSGIQKLKKGDSQTQAAWSSHKPTFIFPFMESSLKIQFLNSSNPNAIFSQSQVSVLYLNTSATKGLTMYFQNEIHFVKKFGVPNTWWFSEHDFVHFFKCRLRLYPRHRRFEYNSLSISGTDFSVIEKQ
jgi:hypothetical protein